VLPAGQKVGFILYKGDARYSAVTFIAGCDPLITDFSQSAFKTISCTLLEPNAVYSIALLFPTGFNDNVRLDLVYTEARFNKQKSHFVMLLTICYPGGK
jgi:hypothetical protein